MDDHPAAPARGLAHGIVLGLLCWAIILFALCGCTDGQIARAESAVAQAKQHLITAVAIVESAQVAVAQAQAVVEASGSSEAKAALTKAQAALAGAQAALPALQQTVAAAEQIAASARQGAAWWQIGLSIVGSIVGIAVPAVRKIRTATSALATASTERDDAILAAEAFKAAEGDAVLDQVRLRQIANGTRDGIQAARARLGLTKS